MNIEKKIAKLDKVNMKVLNVFDKSLDLMESTNNLMLAHKEKLEAEIEASKAVVTDIEVKVSRTELVIQNFKTLLGR
jgi:CO dehydrogenase/acetyl-CoA synthase beta subunit